MWNLTLKAFAFIYCSSGISASTSRLHKRSFDTSKVKVGVMAGAEAQVAEVAAKVAKEQYGLDVELVTFRLRNTKRSTGWRLYRHQRIPTRTVPRSARPARGYKLTIAGNTFVYPIAGYSKEVKSVDEIRMTVPSYCGTKRSNKPRSFSLSSWAMLALCLSQKVQALSNRSWHR